MKHIPDSGVLVRSLLIVSLLFGASSVTTLRAQELDRLVAARRGGDRTDINAPTRLTTATPPAAAVRPRKHIVPVRVSDTADGSRVTVASDATLADYSAYREGGRFHVLIPQADAAQMSGEIKGRGFTDARLERRAGDVLLSFELGANVQPRVRQKFNRLEIFFMAEDAAQQPATAPVGAIPQQQGDEQAQLQQLLKRVEELEGQVRELRANAASASAGVNRATLAIASDDFHRHAPRAWSLRQTLLNESNPVPI